MGSWNQTCFVTNLPICIGNKIVIIPLMLVNEQIAGLTYNATNRYAPFCIPIVGEYNDYGGIENIENERKANEILSKFHFLDKYGNDFYYEDFESFFDAILEKPLFILLNGKSYKINYAMMHYDIYERLVKETYSRNINLTSNMLLGDCLKNKINDFAKNEEYERNGKRLIGQSDVDKEEREKYLLSKYFGILEPLGEDERLNVIKDLLSISCHLKICQNHLEGIIYDILLQDYFANKNEENLSYVLDLFLFKKALELLRKGYFVNTGCGHQGCEFKMHLVVANFVKEFVEKYVSNIEIGDNENLDEYLMEDVWFS